MFAIIDITSGLILGLAADRAQAATGIAIARDCIGARCEEKPVTPDVAAALLANVTLHPLPEVSA